MQMKEEYDLLFVKNIQLDEGWSYSQCLEEKEEKSKDVLKKKRKMKISSTDKIFLQQGDFREILSLKKSKNERTFEPRDPSRRTWNQWLGGETCSLFLSLLVLLLSRLLNGREQEDRLCWYTLKDLFIIFNRISLNIFFSFWQVDWMSR